MGQSANKTRCGEGEARAFSKQIRTSAQKLNLVARMIRGKSVARALVELEFCQRRVSGIVNAENNHNLDVDRLYVAEITVGRALVMKRFRARARGRGAKILKPFSNMVIIVREREDKE